MGDSSHKMCIQNVRLLIAVGANIIPPNVHEVVCLREVGSITVRFKVNK